MTTRRQFIGISCASMMLVSRCDEFRYYSFEFDEDAVELYIFHDGRVGAKHNGINMTLARNGERFQFIDYYCDGEPFKFCAVVSSEMKLKSIEVS